MKGSHVIYIPPIHIYWGCLGKSVLLKTADGTLKTAESVKISDRLLSHDEKTVTVDNIFKGHDETIYRLSCDGFETLMSGAHPVLGENGKGIAVRNLRSGDKIMTENGGMTEVLSVKEELYNDTVYNFTFEGENESVYVIADGIFAGDPNAQNEVSVEPQETEDEKEKRLKLIEEMHSLCQEMHILQFVTLWSEAAPCRRIDYQQNLSAVIRQGNLTAVLRLYLEITEKN